jgi:hypothetical protein
MAEESPMKIQNMQIVAEAVSADGSVKLVGMNVRPRDVEPDVLIYLREQAEQDQRVDPEFDVANESYGG